MGQTLSVVVDSLNCCKGEAKKKKKKKPKDESDKKTQKTTINTYWETINKNTYLRPSQIPDEDLTRQVTAKLPSRTQSNEFEFDKQVLEQEKYQVVLDVIVGKGGFGKVYKVKDQRTGEIMAAKVTELVRRESGGESRHRFESFKNEIFILKRNKHKNIIGLKDHFICNQNLSFILMEFATDGNLEQKLRENHGPFREEMARHYFVQISNAMYFLQTNGIIHGDLKLPNVLLITKNNKDLVKVTDFGCGRVVYRKDGNIEMKSKAIGTIGYMSPEQIIVYIAYNLNRQDLVANMVRKYNPFKSDIWALGVCLFKLVNFHRPFPFQDRFNAQHMVDRLNQMKNGFEMKKNIYKNLSNDCIDILKGMLEFDRFKRIDMKIVMTSKWVMESDQYDKTALN